MEKKNKTVYTTAFKLQVAEDLRNNNLYIREVEKNYGIHRSSSKDRNDFILKKVYKDFQENDVVELL